MSVRILIVEDNADNMKLFQWMLEDEGYECTGAPSAEDGLPMLETGHYDLVIMDISLPGMDGKEATRRLRADERFRTLPIIAATAHAIKGEDAAILAAGVTAIATKPIDEAEFLTMVAQAIAG